jgi:hypothetical protein
MHYCNTCGRGLAGSLKHLRRLSCIRFSVSGRCAEKKRAMWNVGNLSDDSEKGGQGCVRARFDLSSPMYGPYLSAVQFACDGSTFSGIDFELVGSGFRISLVKKRFCSGK